MYRIINVRIRIPDHSLASFIPENLSRVITAKGLSQVYFERISADGLGVK